MGGEPTVAEGVANSEDAPESVIRVNAIVAGTRTGGANLPSVS